MNKPTEAEAILCASFDEFVRDVRKHRYVMARIYRGQQDANWKLRSTFERWLSARFLGAGPRDYDSLFGGRESRLAFCSATLDYFKRLVTGMPTVPQEVLDNDHHLWALGRHYGLVTPLLDWSESPFVASFFAFTDRLMCTNPGLQYGPGFTKHGGISITPEPVAIWEMYYNDDLNVSGEFEVFASRYANAARQKAQSAVFTMLTHKSITDIEAYLASRDRLHLLRRYEIPGTEYRAALASVRQMNIRYDTLFPDPEGAAREANVGPFMNALMLHGE